MEKKKGKDSFNLESLELTIKEDLLIRALRNKWKFGDVIIQMRDGQPVRIKRAFETDDLEN